MTEWDKSNTKCGRFFFLCPSCSDWLSVKLKKTQQSEKEWEQRLSLFSAAPFYFSLPVSHYSCGYNHIHHKQTMLCCLNIHILLAWMLEGPGTKIHRNDLCKEKGQERDDHIINNNKLAGMLVRVNNDSLVHLMLQSISNMCLCQLSVCTSVSAQTTLVTGSTLSRVPSHRKYRLC